MTHTPGPWEYEPPDSGDSSVGLPETPGTIFYEDAEGHVVDICELANPIYLVAASELKDEYDDGTRWIGDAESNARIIVRALELLEALESLLDGLDANTDGRDGLSEEQWDRRCAVARAIIRKARGEA